MNTMNTINNTKKQPTQKLQIQNNENLDTSNNLPKNTHNGNKPLTPPSTPPKSGAGPKSKAAYQ
jgi:hypothetical protein